MLSGQLGRQRLGSQLASSGVLNDLVVGYNRPRWKRRKRARANRMSGQPETMEESNKLLLKSTFGASAHASLCASVETHHLE